MNEYKVIELAKKIRRSGGLTADELKTYFQIMNEKKKANIPWEEIPERLLLILVNDGLVYHVINTKLSVNESDVEDIASVGRIGLVKAIDTYNPDYNVRFSSYAVQIIRNEIYMDYRKLTRKSRVPVNMVINMGDTFFAKEGEDEMTYEDVLADEEDVGEAVVNELFVKQIYKYFVFLTPNEQLSLMYHLGLFGQNPITQTETAKKIGTGRSNCTRKIKSGLDKIRLLLKPYESLSREEKVEYYKIKSKEYPLISEAVEFFKKDIDMW